MIVRELYRKNRRALLALIVAAITWSAIVGARALFARIDAVRQLAAAERELLSRELGLLDDRARLPARIATAAGALDAAQGRLFDAPDALTAEALLSDYVGNAAAESVVFIESIESRTSASPSGGLVAIALAVSATSDLQGIVGFLARLRSGSKLVRVHEIRIEASGRSGTPTGSKADAQVLRMEAMLDGFAAVAPTNGAGAASGGGP